MKLNKQGETLRAAWEQIYFTENNRLGGDSENGIFVEGWSIIDGPEFVKTLKDICGIMLFGYDDAIQITEEWIELYGENERIWYNYTCKEIKEALQKYFE